MTLIDAELLASLEPGGRAKKEPMANTLTAFDDAIADLTPIVQTAAEWAADNATILALNQIGRESDTGKFKFGDGTSLFSALTYSSGEGGSIESHDDVAVAEVTSARTLTDADLYAGTDGAAGAEHRVIPINLGSAGTMRVPAAATAGQVWVFDINQASAVPSVSTVGDVGTLNGFDASGGAVPLIPGTRAMIRVRSNAGSAPEVIIDGAQGEQVVYGDLTGQDMGSALPRTLSGFNAVIEVSGATAGAHTFVAADAGRIRQITAAGDVEIPLEATTDFPDGTLLCAHVLTAGAVNLTIASGGTLNLPPGFTAAARGAGVFIAALKRDGATNVWDALECGLTPT